MWHYGLRRFFRRRAFCLSTGVFSVDGRWRLVKRRSRVPQAFCERFLTGVGDWQNAAAGAVCPRRFAALRAILDGRFDFSQARIFRYGSGCNIFFNLKFCKFAIWFDFYFHRSRRCRILDLFRPNTQIFRKNTSISQNICILPKYLYFSEI